MRSNQGDSDGSEAKGNRISATDDTLAKCGPAPRSAGRDHVDEAGGAQARSGGAPRQTRHEQQRPSGIHPAQIRNKAPHRSLIGENSCRKNETSSRARGRSSGGLPIARGDKHVSDDAHTAGGQAETTQTSATGLLSLLTVADSDVAIRGFRNAETEEPADRRARHSQFVLCTSEPAVPRSARVHMQCRGRRSTGPMITTVSLAQAKHLCEVDDLADDRKSSDPVTQATRGSAPARSGMHESGRPSPKPVDS